MKNENYEICIVGLGYVGLPLAIAFSKKFRLVGYDINLDRVQELKSGTDSTLEIKNNENRLNYSSWRSR